MSWKWSGIMVDGKQEGFGTLDDGGGGGTWIGEFRAGRKEGRWVHVWGGVHDVVYDNNREISSVRRVSDTRSTTTTTKTTMSYCFNIINTRTFTPNNNNNNTFPCILTRLYSPLKYF